MRPYGNERDGRPCSCCNRLYDRKGRGRQRGRTEIHEQLPEQSHASLCVCRQCLEFDEGLYWSAESATAQEN